MNGQIIKISEENCGDYGNIIIFEGPLNGEFLKTGDGTYSINKVFSKEEVNLVQNFVEKTNQDFGRENYKGRVQTF